MNNLFELLQYVGSALPLLIFFSIVIYFIFKYTPKHYHSHWATSAKNFNYSTEDFYQRLQVELQTQTIQGLRIKKVGLRTGSIFSHSRYYLEVIWKDYAFYICAAPFSDNYFISYWLMTRATDTQLLISRIPFVGGWLLRNLYPITFYKIDTASMFQSYVHLATLKIYDEITANTGVRALSDEERKPTLNDFFKR